jgi:hypothetical protein
MTEVSERTPDGPHVEQGVLVGGPEIQAWLVANGVEWIGTP